jgi:hypothetical protein
VKHYRFKGSEGGAQPSLLFEIKIDQQDVRSGYRASDWGLFLRASCVVEGDLDWTPDMVWLVRPESLEEIAPRSPISWPALADQKMISYLVRYYRAQTWRNPQLGLFSQSHESEQDFVGRCRETVRNERDRELRKLRDLFFHRFMELEQRHLRELDRQHFDDHWKNRRRAQIEDLFSAVRGQISRRDLDEQLGDAPLAPLPVRQELDPEMQAKLAHLREDFFSKCSEVRRDFERKAAEVEPYEVPLPYSQIEIVSRGLLWE